MDPQQLDMFGLDDPAQAAAPDPIAKVYRVDDDDQIMDDGDRDDAKD